MFRIKPVMVIASCLMAGTAFFATTGTSDAGRVGGALVREVTIGAGQYEVFMIRFEGHKQARIGVQNASVADLDIQVIDPATLKVVAQDLRTDNDARVKFTPPVTKDYLVLVHNFTQGKGTRYVLFTN